MFGAKWPRKFAPTLTPAESSPTIHLPTIPRIETAETDSAIATVETEIAEAIRTIWTIVPLRPPPPQPTPLNRRRRPRCGGTNPLLNPFSTILTVQCRVLLIERTWDRLRSLLVHIMIRNIVYLLTSFVSYWLIVLYNYHVFTCHPSSNDVRNYFLLKCLEHIFYINTG